MKKPLIFFFLGVSTILCLAALPTTLNTTQFNTTGPLSVKADGLFTNENFYPGADGYSMSIVESSIRWGGTDAAQVAEANAGLIYYDLSEQQFKASKNGGAYAVFGAGTIDGSGTANFIPKFSDSDTLANSSLFDNGTIVSNAVPYLAPDGSATVPSVSFTLDPDVGLFTPGAGVMGFGMNSGERFRFSPSLLSMSSAIVLGWSSTSASSGTVDTSLKREAAGSIRLGGSATTSDTSLLIPGLYTDAGNYHYASHAMTDTAYTISVLTAGTGVDNLGITLTPAGAGVTLVSSELAIGNTANFIDSTGENLHFDAGTVGRIVEMDGGAATVTINNNATFVAAGPSTLTGETTIGSGGVNNDGGGFKHKRVTTGSVNAASTALVTVTWGTAFADTNYTATASVFETTTSSLSISVVHIESVTAAAITVRVINNAAGALTGEVHAFAVHD